LAFILRMQDTSFEAVQLANSAATLGQRLTIRLLADVHVFIESIRRDAILCMNLENAAEVVFGRLASTVDAVQLANSSVKHGQGIMSRRIFDANVFIYRIRRGAVRKLA
jgi:hypothetical protein